MADNVNIITWQNVDVTPVDDALIYETAIGAGGVIYGCEVTLKNSNTMHIAAGHAIICGRKMTIVESDIAIPLSTGGTQLGRLYLQLDLSNTAAPAQMLTEVGGSLTPPTQNENVNIFNGTYEINLYTFNVSPATISDLVRVANPLANILGNFAPIETKLAASQEYLEGAFLIKDNQLYEAMGDINPGDRLVVGGNIIKTTVAEKIAAINKDLEIKTVPITPTSNVLSGNMSCRRMGKIVFVEGYGISLNATGLQIVATGVPVTDVSTPLSTTVWAGAMVGDIYIPTGTDRLLTNYSGGYFAFSMIYIQ